MVGRETGELEVQLDLVGIQGGEFRNDPSRKGPSQLSRRFYINGLVSSCASSPGIG